MSDMNDLNSGPYSPPGQLGYSDTMEAFVSTPKSPLMFVTVDERLPTTTPPGLSNEGV